MVVNEDYGSSGGSDLKASMVKRLRDDYEAARYAVPRTDRVALSVSGTTSFPLNLHGKDSFPGLPEQTKPWKNECMHTCGSLTTPHTSRLSVPLQEFTLVNQDN